jgi:peptidyl-prolyl cis-trans isomerase B (cyclophilin B)
MNHIVKLFIGIIFLSFISCSRPVANFVIKSQETKAPARIILENQSEKADSFYWDFGDGSQSEEMSPDHLYLLSGRYKIKLQALQGNKKDLIEKEIVVMPPQKCLVQLKTPQGAMVIELFDDTPAHRDNFLKLVEDGFYNELLFHRVIDGFMIQGGDPNSRGASAQARLGSGGPGYQIPAEFNVNRVHVKGALAAARQGDQVNPEKKSSGSQFYIVHGREVDEDLLESMEMRKGVKYSEESKKSYIESGGTPFLDFEYTVFGRVIEGMEIIDSVASVKTLPGDRPVEDVTMTLTVIK